MRIVSARVLGEALFFFPVLRGLTKRYCTLAELAADDHAVAALGGDRSALAAAMLAFEANGIAPERVDHMSGLTPDWRLPVGLDGTQPVRRGSTRALGLAARAPRDPADHAGAAGALGDSPAS